MKVRNPKRNTAGTIDCDLFIDGIGWAPFTASPDDCEPHGRDVYEKIEGGKFGAISEVDGTDATTAAAVLERLWRNAELIRADRAIAAITDRDSTADASAWKAYRVALRDWPENEQFPDRSHRPVAPDAGK